MQKSHRAVVAAIAVAVISTQAMGDNAPGASGQLEEIVVTAVKRAANMQEVPISSQTISAARLETAGVTDLLSLSQVSSGLNVVDVGFIQPFIRGVGSTVAGTGFYSSVSAYVDGVYIPRTNSLNTGVGGIDDAESVVILKGPQGSLYGRNATGGAIVITTKTPHPGDPLSGDVEASYGNYADKIFTAHVASGLNDFSAASLSASYHKNSGFIRDLTNGSGTDDANNWSVAGKLVLTPLSNVSMVLSAKLSRSFTREPLFQQLAAPVLPGIIPGLNAPQTLYAATLLSFGLPAASVVPAAGGLKFSNIVGQSYDNETNAWQNGIYGPGHSMDKSFLYNNDLLVSSSIKVNLEKFDLVSITGYNKNQFNSAAEVLDADPTSVPAFGLGAPGIGFSEIASSHMFSQEVQAVSSNSPIQWIAGANYFHERGPVQETGDAFGFSSVISNDTWDVDSIAGFGETTIPLGAFHLTLGGRYTTETYKIYLGADTSGGADESRTDKKATYDARLDYKYDNVLTYVSTGTGFKSGSLNPNNPAAGQAAPETITSYEVGVKSELVDHTLRVNGSVFYYNYSNIQLNVLVPGSSTFLVNGSNSHMRGADLNVDWLAGDRLSFNFDGTVLHATYGNDAIIKPPGSPAGVLAIAGKDLVMTPHFAANVGLDWTLFNLNSGSVKFSPTVRYSSGFWIDSLNTYGSGGLTNSSVTVVNGNLAYTTGDSHWSAALWVLNALDKKYFRSGIDAAGGLSETGIAGRPRQFGVRFGYKF